MDLRKTKTPHKSRIIPLILSLVIMICAVVGDIIWGDHIMQLSVGYSEFLIQLRWLKFLMFFFSYIVFFAIFTCNLLLRPKRSNLSSSPQNLHRSKPCHQLEVTWHLHVRYLRTSCTQTGLS